MADWLKRDEVRYERKHDHKLRDQADEDRDDFFRLLRKAIDLPDDEAAQAIVKACAAHKGKVGKVTVAQLHKMLEEGNVRGLPIPARIRRYRAIGIPEPYILGEIARSQFDRIGERGGPSSKAPRSPTRRTPSSPRDRNRAPRLSAPAGLLKKNVATLPHLLPLRFETA